jgi:hypothetical protein
MKRVTLTVTACVLAVIALLGVSVAAQDANTQKRTFMTFSNTVEMPGVTLPAGTYTFRIADNASRNVVQVLSRDEKEVLGQWLFVPADRPEASSDTVVMFKEAREGSTPAVQFWYYPGERTGREFIYSKDQAAKIAARTGAGVLTEEGRITSEQAQASADAARVADQAGAPATDSNAGLVAGNAIPSPEPAPAPQPEAIGTSGAGAPQATDRAVVNDTQAPVRETQTARAELPRTASSLPLSGLIGLLALFGALGTRSLAVSRR